MKKDKWWLKQEISEIFWRAEIDDNLNIQGANLIFDKIDDAIDQLEEPEKVAIPQFVAEYIEQWKNGGLTMSEWFDFNYGNEEDDEVSKWLYDNDYEENMKREHLLIDAIRYGYEVADEPHYYVAFEGEFNLLYVTHVDIYGENGKFNYNSESDKNHALKFTDKSRAKYLADFLGAIVVEVTK